MRKSYIIWWVVAAVFFWNGVSGFLQGGLFDAPGLLFGMFGIAAVCVFVGYRRWREYQEYQEDRKIRNEYFKSNTKQEGSEEL